MTAPPSPDVHIAPELFNHIADAFARIGIFDRVAVVGSRPSTGGRGPIGSYGLDAVTLAQIERFMHSRHMPLPPTGSSSVQVIDERVNDYVSDELVEELNLCGTVVSISVAVGGRHLAVAFADRNGQRFSLTSGQSEALSTLASTAALIVGERASERERERLQLLSKRTELAREIHDRVSQPIFGVTMALRSDRALDAGERERCLSELAGAMEAIRESLIGLPANATQAEQADLRDELEALARSWKLSCRLNWRLLAPLPVQIEALATRTMKEALRNAAKHATAATVDIDVRINDGAYEFTITNDGVGGGSITGTGIGLRLAAIDAAQHGGFLECRSLAGGGWRVCLVVPVEV